jgi:hypothetical protein
MKYEFGVSLLAMWAAGCQMQSSSTESGGFSAPPSDQGGVVAVGPTANPIGPIGPTTVVTAATPPAPISGGTLLVTQDGLRAVAADPDRDRVSIVDLTQHAVLHTTALMPGDEPGRVVEDAKGRVHVVLRRGGAVVSIDESTGAVVARRAVCGAPRGIAYEASTDRLHVACKSGELVSLPAGDGDVVRRVQLDVDLRDVIVQSNGMLAVTRFKTGDVIFVDSTGALLSRTALTPVMRISDVTMTTDPMTPSVAWRAVSGPGDQIYLLHQYGFASTVHLKPAASGSGADGGDLRPPPLLGTGSSPYGAPPDTCGGLVQAAVSRVFASTDPQMGSPIEAPPLTVDIAVSSDGGWAALAHAGGVARLQADGTTPSGQVMVIATSDLFSRNGDAGNSCTAAGALQVVGQPTAVAFNPSNSDDAKATNTWIVVQSREPAALYAFRDVINKPVIISLGGDSVLDTGHELFHRDAGGGIACASCHPEGGEDGRVWKFDTVGDRRTQAVHVGLEGTEPFHWDGDMTDFGMLVDEVMVKRMGGTPQTVDAKAAMQHWLFQLRPPAPIVDASDPHAVSGRALFESANVGCSGCHSGPKLTSNQNVYVGTTADGVTLQVPSLHGVGYRAPFIHNGCAATLRDRFNPTCGGGDRHGNTSQLSDNQVGDLIAYLNSL